MELELIKFIKENEDWYSRLKKKPYNLRYDETEDYILFKYNQVGSKFSNPIVQECRGLILRKSDLKPVCVPFYKFFNYGEENAHDIDWGSAVAQKKYDGSLIKIWFDERWSISTNGKIDASEAMYGDGTKSFEQLVRNTFDMSLTYFMNPNYTYMFELCTPDNRIVVTHDEAKMVYLGARNNRTLEEVYWPNGYVIPYFEQVKTYGFKSLEEAVNNAKELPHNEEGYVIVDKNFNRVKVKSPAYVAVHHLVSKVASKKHILEILLKGEEEEILNYFPELQKDFDIVKKALDDYIIDVYGDWGEMFEQEKEKLTRKKFAEWAKTTTNPGIMFKLYDDIDYNWLENIKSTHPERLLRLIGLK